MNVMMAFSDRLSAMKEKQGSAEQKKKEEAEKIAETARLEREAKRSELAAERDAVVAEFSQAEQTANEARDAVAEADAFAQEQGENLDPDAKAEIEAIKGEAAEAQKTFSVLKTRLETLQKEIAAFEAAGAEKVQETAPSESEDVAEVPPSASEVPPVEVAEVKKGFLESMTNEEFAELEAEYGSMISERGNLYKEVSGELGKMGDLILPLLKQSADLFGVTDLEALQGNEFRGANDIALLMKEFNKFDESLTGDQKEEGLSFNFFLNKVAEIKVPVLEFNSKLKKFKELFSRKNSAIESAQKIQEKINSILVERKLFDEKVKVMRDRLTIDDLQEYDGMNWSDEITLSDAMNKEKSRRQLAATKAA